MLCQVVVREVCAFRQVNYRDGGQQDAKWEEGFPPEMDCQQNQEGM